MVEAKSWFYRGYLARLADEDGEYLTPVPRDATAFGRTQWSAGRYAADERLFVDPRYRGGNMADYNPARPVKPRME